MDIDQNKPAIIYFLAVDARIKFGNRSALEWVPDQSGEEAQRPHHRREVQHLPPCLPAGRFTDYKEKVIDLLKRVTTVSVGTMEEVVNSMNAVMR